MNEMSPALRRRLPVYFRTLIRLYGTGKERVSSEELACEMDLVPSQVRTDMKAIGCVGQRSYGYGIAPLYKKIADILQLSDKYHAIIVGGTHLACAIAEDPIFTKRGLVLSAFFMPEGKSCPAELPDRCPMLPLSELNSYFEKEPPHIAVVTDEEAASAVLDSAERYSEKCRCEVWNFSSTDIRSEKITVKNIHMSDYLMLLCLDAGK